MPPRGLEGVQMFLEMSESFFDNVWGGFKRNLPTAGVFDQHIDVFPRLLLTTGVCDQHIGIYSRLFLNCLWVVWVERKGS